MSISFICWVLVKHNSLSMRLFVGFSSVVLKINEPFGSSILLLHTQSIHMFQDCWDINEFSTPTSVLFHSKTSQNIDKDLCYWILQRNSIFQNTILMHWARVCLRVSYPVPLSDMDSYDTKLFGKNFLKSLKDKAVFVSTSSILQGWTPLYSKPF